MRGGDFSCTLFIDAHPNPCVGVAGFAGKPRRQAARCERDMNGRQRRLTSDIDAGAGGAREFTGGGNFAWLGVGRKSDR